MFWVVLVGSVRASMTSVSSDGSLMRLAVLRSIRHPVENVHEVRCLAAGSNTWTAADDPPGIVKMGWPSKMTNLLFSNFQTNQGCGENHWFLESDSCPASARK